MMVKQGASTVTPRLRFPEFRGKVGWQAENLGAICEVLNNRRCPITSKDRVPGPFPYYGASGIVDSVNDYIFDERLLLVGEDGAKWGRFEATAFIAEGKYWVNNHAHVLKSIGIKDSLLESYLTMLDIAPFVTGAAPPKLTLGKLKSIPIPVPATAAEQQKIADCLTSLDEVIAAQGRKVAALKAYKRALMQQLFPREGETRPRLRFPKFRNASEWAAKVLGKAATFYNGRAYAKEELLERGKYKVLRVGNFFTNDHWYYSDLELEDTKYCDEGDLLYAWSASFGPRIWRGGKTIYHYHLWKVVEHEGIDRGFLFYRLHAETEKMRARAANGIGMFHITKGTIENWMSSFPELDEQQRIADCLSSLGSQIAAESDQLTAIKTHKQGLMQQLFPAPEGVGA